MKKKTRTIILTTSLIALAGLVALGFWIFASDEDPPADADLVLTGRAVAAGENGFSLLDLGKDAIIWPQPLGSFKAHQILEGGEFEPV